MNPLVAVLAVTFLAVTVLSLLFVLTIIALEVTVTVRGWFHRRAEKNWDDEWRRRLQQ